MSTVANDLRANGRDREKGLASKAGKAARRAKADAKEEVSNFFSDVEDLVKKVANISATDVAEVRAKIEDSMERARGLMEDGVKSVRERTRNAANATDGYVRERPWTAIGIAAAVGLLLGFRATRRE